MHGSARLLPSRMWLAEFEHAHENVGLPPDAP